MPVASRTVQPQPQSQVLASLIGCRVRIRPRRDQRLATQVRIIANTVQALNAISLNLQGSLLLLLLWTKYGRTSIPPHIPHWSSKFPPLVYASGALSASFADAAVNAPGCPFPETNGPFSFVNRGSKPRRSAHAGPYSSPPVICLLCDTSGERRALSWVAGHATVSI